MVGDVDYCRLIAPSPECRTQYVTKLIKKINFRKSGFESGAAKRKAASVGGLPEKLVCVTVRALSSERHQFVEFAPLVFVEQASSLVARHLESGAGADCDMLRLHP